MIIIDSDNYGEHGIETMFFPGGEPHAKIPDFKDESILLFLKPRTWNDIGIAAVVIDALEQQRSWFSVFCPYYPGARQDRTDGFTPFTLGLMTRIIGRGVKFSMSVFDPHSNAIDGVMNANVFMPRHLPIPIRDGVAGIIAPDAGAVSRATEFRDTFYPGKPIVECSKKRDFTSGKFMGYSMPKLPRKGHYIVVDDICDGGGTFNLLAEAFARHAGWDTDKYSLELFVSHGIFSKGIEAISQVYSKITTTDSWCRTDTSLPNSVRADDRLEVIPLLPNLKEFLCA